MTNYPQMVMVKVTQSI